MALFRRKAASAQPSDTPAAVKELRRPHMRRVVAYYVRKTLTLFSWIFYPVGVIWLLLLPRDEFHHKASVDENALLPGQTTKYFSSMDMYAVNSYRLRVNQLASQTRSPAEYAAFIQSELNGFGMEASIQNFVLATNQGATIGANSYGISRAARGDGTEAIVISSPWMDDGGKVNADGVGYVLAFAKFVTKFSHWSKDFIFLVTHPSPMGTRAWLEAYHGEQPGPNDALQYDPLETHSGAIQEALNLEFGGEGDYAAIEILVDGLNGQLPNADLVTTVVNCAQYEGIPVALHQAVTPEKFDSNWTRYLHKADILVEYMKSQALGLPRSDHALYAKYHIESITLRAIKDIPGAQYRVSGEQIGRAIESALRSFNNLLERLHHAYWFYIMPTAASYIPISVYIPPVILLSVTLVFQSLVMWWMSGEPGQTAPARSQRVKDSPYVARSPQLSSFNTRTRPIFLPIVTMFLCHATGAFALYMSPTILYIAQHGDINPLNMAACVLIVTAVIYGFMIPTLQRLMEGSGASTATTAPAWMVVKCIACAELGAALIALSTLNPSLSIALAIPSVPAFLLAKPTGSHNSFAIQLIALFLASPIGILGAISLLTGLGTAQDLVRRSADGWSLYGAWLFPFVLLVYWPLNLVGHVIVGMEQ
ncbi:Gaa1-like protein [Powellomyces hirtus]|nr:Gaa1-like protein [Powellomyces hirtus]